MKDQAWGKLEILYIADQALLKAIPELILIDDSYCFGRPTPINTTDKSHTSFKKITLNKPFISSNHFTISKSVESENSSHFNMFISDFSSNGTYVNNLMLTKGNQTPIKYGDSISLRFKDEDQIIFRLIAVSSPPESTPVNLNNKSTFSQTEFSEDMISEALALKPQLTAIREEKGILEEQLSTYRSKLEQSKNDILKLELDLKQESQLFEEEKSKNLHLSNLLSEIETKASTAEARCIILDNNLIETKNQIKTLKSSISAFEDREKQKARLSSDLESMEADLTAQAKVLEIKNNVIEELTKTLMKERQHHKAQAIASQSIIKQLCDNSEIKDQLYKKINVYALSLQQTIRSIYDIISSKETPNLLDQDSFTSINADYDSVCKDYHNIMLLFSRETEKEKTFKECQSPENRTIVTLENIPQEVGNVVANEIHLFGENGGEQDDIVFTQMAGDDKDKVSHSDAINSVTNQEELSKDSEVAANNQLSNDLNNNLVVVEGGDGGIDGNESLLTTHHQGQGEVAVAVVDGNINISMNFSEDISIASPIPTSHVNADRDRDRSPSGPIKSHSKKSLASPNNRNVNRSTPVSKKSKLTSDITSPYDQNDFSQQSMDTSSQETSYSRNRKRSKPDSLKF